MIILLAILSIIFIITLYFVQSGKALDFDAKISEAIFCKRNRTLTSIMLFFTTIGKGKFVLLICMLLFVIPVPGNILPKTAGLGALVTFLFSNPLKKIVKRVRPDGNRLVQESDFSFPSSHAFAAAALYGGIALNASLFHFPLSIAAVIVSLIFIILIGFSRIYLGIHYLTDVIGGWCLGGVIAIIFTLIM